MAWVVLQQLAVISGEVQIEIWIREEELEKSEIGQEQDWD